MSKEKILEAYEDLAEDYNALIDHKPHNAYYDRPNTLRLIPVIKGKHILDAACGPGKYAEILLGQGAMVTGFDISPKMIALANERNNGRGEFYVHDLSQPMITLKDESFDTVVCALAMHYLEDWNPTLREFARVLKPNGSLVLSIEHPFFEYEYFKSKKYFEVEAVAATWSGFGKDVIVHSYRRPLMECILPITRNGFYIDQLIEPKPEPEFEKYDKKHFKELNAFPSFMHIRAVKR
ncbi:class I SAM-dependent methyltransferase [Aggregatimonas sangjinii]|uniref:Class I SAM-dependent methyltransferase n=1 Tax=Aggregatimonas sangjinii TaxID=2583587 RepID=A0A5B7STR1_9FLAO|nr:class I SAM-dependent methyltransferase [Aggregatimonas sangjinii]QCX00729.1 class I SAM-dependent methyltransferase [Aggregatimonas sangjinii]